MVTRISILIFALLVTASACERQREERTLPKVDSAVQVEKGAQSPVEREQFAREVQKEIDELSAQIAELRKKTLTATGKAKEKIEQKIVALEQEQRAVEKQLVAMKSALGERWKDFRTDINEAIGKLRKSVRDAI